MIVYIQKIDGGHLSFPISGREGRGNINLKNKKIMVLFNCSRALFHEQILRVMSFYSYDSASRK